MRHLDEQRLMIVQLRKEMLKKCEEANLLASLPDRQDVIEAIIPYVIKLVK